MITLSTTKKYMLVGAGVALAAPLLMQTSAAVATANAIGLCARGIFTAMIAPAAAVAGPAQVGWGTYAIWALGGAGIGGLVKWFSESNRKEKTICVMATISLVITVSAWLLFSGAAALSSSFALFAICYQLLDDYQMGGYFAFYAEKPRCRWNELPGTKEATDCIAGIMFPGASSTTILQRADASCYNKDTSKNTYTIRRLLLAGPTGTGKSSLAEGLAAELFWKVIRVEAKDLVGGDPLHIGGRLANLTYQASRNSGAVILIDEIDAFGQNRTHSRASPQRDLAVTAFMGWLQNLDQKKGRFCVVMTTNYPHNIDPAFTRPGRCDGIIRVDRPNATQRKEILDYYLQRWSLQRYIQEEHIRQMENWTGADVRMLALELKRLEVITPEDVRRVIGRVHEIKAMEMRSQLQDGLSVDGNGVVEDANEQHRRVRTLLRTIVHLLGFSPTDVIPKLIVD